MVWIPWCCCVRVRVIPELQRGGFGEFALDRLLILEGQTPQPLGVLAQVGAGSLGIVGEAGVHHIACQLQTLGRVGDAVDPGPQGGELRGDVEAVETQVGIEKGPDGGIAAGPGTAWARSCAACFSGNTPIMSGSHSSNCGAASRWSQ